MLLRIVSAQTAAVCASVYWGGEGGGGQVRKGGLVCVVRGEGDGLTVRSWTHTGD